MAVHQGIYASPMEVKPNRDLIKNTSTNRKLWLIEYEVKRYSKGAAIVRAKDAIEAETLLRSQGSFNRGDYSIERITEIPLSSHSALLWEQSVKCFEPN